MQHVRELLPGGRDHCHTREVLTYLDRLGIGESLRATVLKIFKRQAKRAIRQVESKRERILGSVCIPR